MTTWMHTPRVSAGERATGAGSTGGSEVRTRNDSRGLVVLAGAFASVLAGAVLCALLLGGAARTVPAPAPGPAPVVASESATTASPR